MSSYADSGRRAARRVGRYEIGPEVGRGGMAAVYVARQIDLDRVVALKELRVFQAAEAAFAQRFLREARLAGSFSHPNIVTVHDYFEADGLPYIAMEYLPRGSLRRHVRRVSPAQAGAVLEGVLAGLAHAEQRQVVHRDIKPENLLVTAEGGVKIADFGIAKATLAVDGGPMLTSTGTTVGTPNYIAPEQAMARELGPWTDLYSLGLTAFELFAGRAPFADTQEPMAIVLRQVNEPVPRLRDVAPYVPAWLSDWVGWLAAKNPAERPQSAVQAWESLEEMLIAELGPRWRHGAQLLELDGGREPSFSEQPTPLRATPGQADPRLAPTAMPRRPLPEAPPPPAAPAGRRRISRGVVLVGAVAAFVFAALALAGRPAPQSAQPTAPVAQRAGSSPAVPTASSPELASRAASARALAADYDRSADRIGKRRTGSKADAQLVSQLRRVADDYRAAGTAAERGDLAAYTDALTAAEAGRTAVAGRLGAAESATRAPKPKRKTTPKPTRPRAQTQPVPTQPAAPEPAQTPCSGDSVSDDPSDEDCGGEA